MRINIELGQEHKLDPWSVVRMYVCLPQHLAESEHYMSAQVKTNVDETKRADFDRQLFLVGYDLFLLLYDLVVLYHLAMVHRISHLWFLCVLQNFCISISYCVSVMTYAARVLTDSLQ